MEQIYKNIYSVRLKNVEGDRLFSYFIVTEKHIFVIDTGTHKEDAKTILECILPFKKEKEVMIINTHYHYDHVNGNKYISDNVICSAKTATILNFEPSIKITETKEYDGLIFFPSKGHTDDGICIYHNDSGFLFVGDNIGDDNINIVPELENSAEEYKQALDEMLKYKPVKICSAHNYIKKTKFLYRILKRLK